MWSIACRVPSAVARAPGTLVTATLARRCSLEGSRALSLRAGLQRARPAGTTLRRFVSSDDPPSSRRPAKRQPPASNDAALKRGAAGVALVGLGAVVSYNLSDTVRNGVDGTFPALGEILSDFGETVNTVGETFEDWNDTTREWFDSIGYMFVAEKPEPWLLSLAEMKYPENIPTLVLDLDKVILHLEHDRRLGWQVVKRPFADQFFNQLSHYYEIVIFSDDVYPVGMDIAVKWNLPVTSVLHREFCRKKRNHFVKDISKLGRKLDKMIILDHDEKAFQLQPENGVLIKPFGGDPNDCELLDLLEFLKAAATSPTDIRKFVEKFEGGDVDVGRRYLLHKQDQDVKVEQRRTLGRKFSTSARPGFPSNPNQQTFR